MSSILPVETFTFDTSLGKLEVLYDPNDPAYFWETFSHVIVLFVSLNYQKQQYTCNIALNDLVTMNYVFRRPKKILKTIRCKPYIAMEDQKFILRWKHDLELTLLKRSEAKKQEKYQLRRALDRLENCCEYILILFLLLCFYILYSKK